jgi:dTDP-glucose 4,6-dehydratase
MARILVTGGLGVVGTWLVRELRERHHDVISCDLAHQPDEVAFGLQGDLREPRYARCDIGEFRQLARLFEHFGRFDYVFHCAAEFGRWNGEDFYETLWRTNVIGTKHLLRLQESQRFRLVHFSSSEVYGDYPHLMVEHITDEVEIKQLNDYAMSKWVNEMQIRNAIAQHGVESVVVRLFNTYGPGEYYSPYRSVNCRFLYCALHGLPWTVYRGHARTSTFLADTIRTVANLVEHFRPGETYNIGGDQLHTIEELSDLVLKVTGASPTLVRYADAEPLTTKTKLVDNSKAVRDLGHRSTCSLEEGLRLTADWMRQVYKPDR